MSLDAMVLAAHFMGKPSVPKDMPGQVLYCWQVGHNESL